MNEWKRLVAHFRKELNRLFPECEQINIGVSGPNDGPYTLTMTPDGGETIIEWNQVYENTRYYTFNKKGSNTVITIPHEDSRCGTE